VSQCRSFHHHYRNRLTWNEWFRIPIQKPTSHCEFLGDLPDTATKLSSSLRRRRRKTQTRTWSRRTSEWKQRVWSLWSCKACWSRAKAMHWWGLQTDRISFLAELATWLDPGECWAHNLVVRKRISDDCVFVEMRTFDSLPGWKVPPLILMVPAVEEPLVMGIVMSLLAFRFVNLMSLGSIWRYPSDQINCSSTTIR